jgi:hypothetical protein
MDCSNLYSQFRGWFHPIATCVEELIGGIPFKDVIDRQWVALMQSSGGESLYDKLSAIVCMN